MQERFNNYCVNHLDLSVPDISYYSSLPLCALDAVLSIRLNYDRNVIPALQRLCDNIEIPMMAPEPHTMPTEKEQILVSAFIRKLEEHNLWSIDGLRSIIGDYKTAGSKQIYKADAFIQFINIMIRHKVETFQKLNSLADQSALGRELRSIKGQKVSVDYFFMLAGEQNDVKVDMHLTRFAQNATEVNNLSPQQIKDLFINAATFFSNNGTPLTPRHLDHIVWNWQRGR